MLLFGLGLLLGIVLKDHLLGLVDFVVNHVKGLIDDVVVIKDKLLKVLHLK